jgi:Transcriptional regulator, contains sigma factor-related N-terminal domain
VSKTLQERFNERYTPEPMSGCWLWTGAVHDSGYGLLDEVGRKIRAHRFSWTLRRGEVPDGVLVLHKCDVRSCVNPDHLFLGTHADNSRDMVTKGRSQRGEKHYDAKLTEGQVVEVRRLYYSGAWTQRELALKFRVSQTLVSWITRRKAWKHV